MVTTIRIASLLLQLIAILLLMLILMFIVLVRVLSRLILISSDSRSYYSNSHHGYSYQ